MIFTTAVWGLLLGAIVALGYTILKIIWIYRQDPGTDELKKISSHVSEGSIIFLIREYKILLPFVIVVATLLFFFNTGINKMQAIAFLMGVCASAGAGFIGMKVATTANSRTTTAAMKGISPALKISFAGGSVMGMSVVGLALLGLFILFFLLKTIIGINVIVFQDQFLPIITGFSLGASAIALFARLGGGIFTKAADISADLVGKVEEGIPEDDSRNPATIADNIGDNVGDVAGMGADLFESFVGSIIGSLILAFTVPVSDNTKFILASIPLIMVIIGTIASIIGIFFVRIKEGGSTQEVLKIQKALNLGTYSATAIVFIMLYPILIFVFQGVGETDLSVISPLRIFFSAIIGSILGIVIGATIEYYTGFGSKPVKEIVKSSVTGPATNIITGIGKGMVSCLLPIVAIGITIGISFLLSGLFGIAITALGILITIGIHIAVDAYGPIADNAGGLAVMSKYPSSVRDVTDKLDAVGNTTAATGKGFAIGSAALTAIILFSSFKATAGIEVIDLSSTPVMIGLLLGSVIPYVYSSLSMEAVGRASLKMIEEVRIQFKTIPGILKNKNEPDFNKCIEISTNAALKEMFVPGLGAVIVPILVGFLGGVEMLSGLLAGVTANGIVLAIFMTNAGGAWDNAKKMIEGGIEGGRGSETHKAAVVGDTVGDPFKDTAGPSLNILMKLMAIVSLIIVPLL